MRTSTRGFSLLELLVVLLLIGFITSLVSPSISLLARKGEQDAERKEVQQIVHTWARLSLSREQAYELSFDGPLLRVHDLDSPAFDTTSLSSNLFHREFEHLRFKRQKVRIFKSGMLDSRVIAYHLVGGASGEIVVSDLLTPP